jgi:hypothetical protein
VKLKPVVSSNVRAVGTEGDDLIVMFQNGKAYRYLGAAGKAEELRAAESVGKFMNAAIKPAFEFAKIENEDITVEGEQT